ncbi:MAG: Glu-tRNA(Gln) amidotransferase subunit GatE [Nanohaloarchaea archaeon]|nr:Glu-tRNA(Gln) amidotransferase subunit GatE [Candidatus Nanohaloarchaea archaeon]
MDIDYKKIGFKCGLEIHQALDTGKLFCNCSSALDENKEFSEIKRHLRPVAGETGTVDASARFESLRKRNFIYHAFKDEACLVEMDAEPPHNINETAKKTALLFAMLLGMDIPEEIHVMRKTVTDGSATSGFQRTALVATGNDRSCIETSKGKIYFENMSLEEDAGKIIKKEGNRTTHYSLSRLGIPLIEISTSPDIKDADHVKETAAKIGSLLRAFPETKRGIGTIRQDINISIFGGIRTEVKGWQDLSRITLITENEVKRHLFLINLKSELEEKNIKKIDIRPIEVTDIFVNTKSRLISDLIRRNAIVIAIKIPGFNGILKREVCPKKTFGRELSEYAKAFGANGMVHTDEDLSKYKLVHEFNILKEKLDAKDDDLILMIAESKTIAEQSIDAVIKRTRYCLEGVPAETRIPNHVDATSSYARPLSGAHRMYPETDVATMKITDEYLTEIKKDMPETLESKRKRFEKDLKLNSELASTIISSPYLTHFETLSQNHKDVDAKDIANFFINTLSDLKKRENIDITSLSLDNFEDIFKNISCGKLLKDTIPQFVKIKVKHPELFADEIMTNYDLAPLSESEVTKIIRLIIEENQNAPMGAVIGMSMSKLKGRFDSKKIAKIVSANIGKNKKK